MADLPFKYSIHFPDTDSPKEEDDERHSFEIIDKCEAESPTPVVILLGWAGCQEKHLAKYSPMYEKKGFITVQVMVPARTLFFQSHKVSDVAHGLLGLLGKNKICDNPIVFHVFSNGGSMVYMHLIGLLHSQKSRLQQMLSVRGVIFDSAPGKPRMLNAVRAFMSTLHTHPILRYILGFCLLIYMLVIRFLLAMLPACIKSSYGFKLYTRVCDDPTECPQLFLYSKADRIIMAEDVEEVVSRRKARGVDVKAVCWEDSAHVAHLRRHPEIYMKTCLDFVDACVEAKINE